MYHAASNSSTWLSGQFWGFMFSVLPTLIHTNVSSPLNELFCDPGGGAYFLSFNLLSSAGYFSLPERLLTALGLLPTWFSLVSLFPSLHSFCISPGLFLRSHLLSLLAYQCFLRCQWRLLNSLQTFLMLSVSSPWKFEVLCPWVSFILDSFTLLLNSKVYPVSSMLAYFLLSSVLLPILWKFIAESPVISINSPL